MPFQSGYGTGYRSGTGFLRYRGNPIVSFSRGSPEHETIRKAIFAGDYGAHEFRTAKYGLAVTGGGEKPARITSYNVCYTKLLRAREQDGKEYASKGNAEGVGRD